MSVPGQKPDQSRAFPARRLLLFNTVYRGPRTVARHENGPVHVSRRLYLEHIASQGRGPAHSQSRGRSDLARRDLDEPG